MIRNAIEFLACLLVAALLIAAAFSAIFGAGWAAVHLLGPPLFRYLPEPLAYLTTAAISALAVYGLIFKGPDFVSRQIRRLRKGASST